MKYVFLAIASLAFTAPAFAQENLEQPRVPHDGVGVDYSQPYMNDLLLRMERPTDGMLIRRGAQPCEEELAKLQADRKQELLEAFKACVDREREKLERYSAMPGPGVKPPLYVPDPDAPPFVPRLPLAPSHPNVQN